jgi:hypothetical protein
MRERFRSFDSKISFFAFADIITAVSGMLIFITLLLATDLGRPTDSRSQAANAELQRRLQETLAQQAKADGENRNLQTLLSTANTAPAPDKLESDISRLRSELAAEKSKHAGMGEELAASESALAERDKLLGITKVQESIQQGIEELETLGRENAKVREATAVLEQKIAGVQSKILKLRAREGQLWLIPDRSTTAKEPILAVVSGSGLRLERFNHPDEARQFDGSGAQAGFESYLKHAKASDQYVVFLIRPSGIGLFKDLEQTAKDKGFEVGSDALEEDRQVHFSTPPPLEEDSTPKKPAAGATAAPPPIAAPAAAPGTNSPSRSRSRAAATAPTNPVPPAGASPPVPPPPRPKSWWQRLLEWLGISK